MTLLMRTQSTSDTARTPARSGVPGGPSSHSAECSSNHPCPCLSRLSLQRVVLKTSFTPITPTRPVQGPHEV